MGLTACASRSATSRERGGEVKDPIVAAARENFILMIVGGLTLNPSTQMQIVRAQETPTTKLNVPIWMRPLEATWMADQSRCRRVSGSSVDDRDLEAYQRNGGDVEAVEVTELQEHLLAHHGAHARRSRHGSGLSPGRNRNRAAHQVANLLAKETLEMSASFTNRRLNPPTGPTRTWPASHATVIQDSRADVAADEFKYEDRRSTVLARRYGRVRKLNSATRHKISRQRAQAARRDFKVSEPAVVLELPA